MRVTLTSAAGPRSPELRLRRLRFRLGVGVATPTAINRRSTTSSRISKRKMRQLLLSVVVVIVALLVVHGAAKQAAAVMLHPTQWAVVEALRAEWVNFEGRASWIGDNTCEDMHGLTCTADGLITKIDLSFKTLSSSIPAAIASLLSLQYLTLRNCSLSGSIPSALGHLTRLKLLTVSENGLSGSIPATLGDMAALQYLKLSDNELSGSLPNSLDRLSNLAALILSRNQLTGSLPPTLTRLPLLQTLDVSSNWLDGSLPAEIGSFPVLQNLRLNGNRLSGSLPPTIGSIRTLRTLQLSDNALSGLPPSTLGDLTSLDQMFLANNEFSGDLPATISNIPFIITIDLSGNLFSSSLPSQWSALSVLRKLHIHHTPLSGAIPAAIGAMTNLRDIRLCCNALTGSLPSEIGLLTKLTHLDLSSNRLSGSLPATLSAIQHATAILLRDNQLTGAVLPRPSAATQQFQLDSNFFTTWFPYAPATCAGSTLWANCLPVPTVFSTPTGYLCPDNVPLPEGVYRQRSAAACAAFCGLLVSPTAGTVTRVPCGGRGRCFFEGPNRVPTCACDKGYRNGEDPGTCVDEGFDPNSVTLTSKDNPKAMDMFGSASLATNGAITLTPSKPAMWGAALLSAPIRLFSFDVKAGGAGRQIGFEAEFAFRLAADHGNGTSGFAFVISASNIPPGNDPGAGGGGGGGVADLGYAGMDAQSVAVEFDTRMDAAAKDPSSNHVGVDAAGSTVSLASAALPPSLTLNDGGEKQAWVTYSPLKGGLLEVFLASGGSSGAGAGAGDKPVVPVLSVKIALWKVLKPGVSPAVVDSYYFGFVGASGQPPQEQTITSWSIVTGFPSRQIATGFPLGLVLESKQLAAAPVNPLFRYASVGYEPAGSTTTGSPAQGGTAVETWVVNANHSWVQPSLHWELRDQGTCGDCWAYGVVQSIEAAHAILHHRSAPLLSVDQLRADVGADCSGGSPFVAFQYLTLASKAGKGLLEESQFLQLSSAAGKGGKSGGNSGGSGGKSGGWLAQGLRVPFLERLKRALMQWRARGKKAKKKPQKGLRISGFERTSFYGWFGLMLAVQRQPVVVHIEASAPSFNDYDGFYKYADPECFTYNLNHVVLLVGYRLVGSDEDFPHMAPPFWIIRNSWGPDWGDGGHMRMDVQGGDGVCGINTLPGLYPVVKSSSDPCNGGAAHDSSGALLNPCGGFPCRRDGRTNKCECTAPFVQANNADGSRTCAYVDVCGSSNGNPCAVGTCVNDGAGSYSCVCPLGFRQGTTVDGTLSCAPGSSNGSYTVLADGVSCADVHSMYGLTLLQFQAQNSHVNCAKPLPRNTRLNITSALPLCSVFYTAAQGDSCLSVAVLFWLDTNCDPSDQPCVEAFQALNPGVDCTTNSGALSASQVVCVERSSAAVDAGGGGGDAVVPVCSQTYAVQGGESCEALRSVPSPPLSRLDFYRLNPGINCEKLVPPNGVGATTGFEVCIQSTSSYRAGSCPRSNFHTVLNNDRCSTIQFRYFKGIKSCYKWINGYDCLDKLKQGTRICLPDPKKIKKGKCSV
ncbi:hypothetical protein CLOM_g10991 [Closterium sp. NIES-68]|nr:hypothetical protein CLOM_g10991 [Closterium sp. NIES-68]GJP71157.1 hypothetical protein CLOP_g2004 [Closterium sp. NIES-67]